MIFPEESKFLELAKQGNLIPIGREFPADAETPVSAYIKLSGQPGGAAFLLASAETGGRLGRYSFVGSRPTAVMEFRAGRVRLTTLSGEVQEKAPENPDPLDEVQEMGKTETEIALGLLNQTHHPSAQPIPASCKTLRCSAPPQD